MMNIREVKEVLDQIEYKGRKKFYELTPIMFGSEYGYHITVKIPVRDRLTGKREKIYTHYTYTPTEMHNLKAPNIVKRVKTMLQYLESHEVEENLLFKGMRVFDPHPDELSGPNVEEEKKDEEAWQLYQKGKILQELKKAK